MKFHAVNRTHAIVSGGSIAGLLAARVLSDHFTKVTVFEKDSLSIRRNPRPGVPQGRHLHILLPAGVEAIENLFPGGMAALVRDGARRFDYGMSRLYVYGTWLPCVQTDLMALAQTRPLLEQHLRQWIGAIPNVRVIDEATVDAPVLDSTNSRITGVEFSMKVATRKQRLDADLVIDASGRSTRLLRWLVENGFGSVPESRVGINLGYATGRFRVPEKLRPESPLLYIVGPPPRATKVGVIFQAENGIVFGGMGGYHGDYPPADPTGFLQFAKSLSQPHIFDVLLHSELCSPIERYRISHSVRRHYDSMRHFPTGLLPIGDTICSLDPAFGQGMSIAALEAKALSHSLANSHAVDARFQRDYFRRVNPVINAAWDLSSCENLRYPQTTGARSWLAPLASRYMTFLVNARDPRVMAEVYKVISLTTDLATVLHPALALRALTKRSAAAHR